MLRGVHIANFKSIQELELPLGRINVLIGANGAGKSNILEAIAFASAATRNKLEHEFLTTRGIRTTEPRFMRAAFDPSSDDIINIVLKKSNGNEFHCNLKAVELATAEQWINTTPFGISKQDLLKPSRDLQIIEATTDDKNLLTKEVADKVRKITADLEHSDKKSKDAIKSASAGLILLGLLGVGLVDVYAKLTGQQKPTDVAEILRSAFGREWPSWPDFLIYAPENSALRTFQAEGQILPLGVKGEGLFAQLKALSAPEHADRLTAIIDKLTLLDWFERFEFPKGLSPGERSLRIRDRYLAENALFDQRSANEGFLFLLFYFTLCVSPDTPSFFAIDNIDASLNPKLCSALVTEMADLANRYDKQIVLTTHNPAALDGLNLHDDEQRLFVVARNRHGHTKVRRVDPPTPLGGEPPIKLSEAFLRGYIGGLPKNF